MGESVAADELREVIFLAEDNDAVHRVVSHKSMYQGPEEVILLLRINFNKNIQGQEIVQSIQLLRQTIQGRYPHYQHLFIEPVPEVSK